MILKSIMFSQHIELVIITSFAITVPKHFLSGNRNPRKPAGLYFILKLSVDGVLVLYGSPLLDWVGVGTVGDEGSDVVETSCVDVLENISVEFHGEKLQPWLL